MLQILRPQLLLLRCVDFSNSLFSLGIYNTLRFSTVSGGLCSDDTVDSLHAREFRKAFTEAVQNGSHFL